MEIGHQNMMGPYRMASEESLKFSSMKVTWSVLLFRSIDLVGAPSYPLPTHHKAALPRPSSYFQIFFCPHRQEPNHKHVAL